MFAILQLKNCPPPTVGRFFIYFLIYDDISRTPGYAILFNYLFYFSGLYLGLKCAKYLCKMHNKMFKSSYSV